MPSAGSLDGRVVLVTGASRGIGYAVSLEAARRGAHIVAVARTVGGLEELDDAIRGLGGAATLVPLDLTDGDGVDRLGASIFERWGRLDGLVGNAGQLGSITPVPHIKPDELAKVFALNVFANQRLLRALDLPLRQSSAGRVVMISSGAARSNRPFWGPYAASKAALDALTRIYAAEMANTGIRVNAFSPGAVRTAMRAKAMPGEDPMTLPPPEAVAPYVVDMLAPAWAQTGRVFDFTSKVTREL